MNRRDFAKGLGLLPLASFVGETKAEQKPEPNFSFSFQTDINLQPWFELGQIGPNYRYIEFPLLTTLTVNLKELRLVYNAFNIGIQYRNIKTATEEWISSVHKWCARVQPKAIESLVEATINPCMLSTKDYEKFLKTDPKNGSKNYMLYGEKFNLSYAMILTEGEGYVKT